MIRVGIGGWNYEPWEETFYPPKLAAAKQLEYASSKVTAIEINSTFYRTQTAASSRPASTSSRSCVETAPIAPASISCRITALAAIRRSVVFVPCRISSSR